MNLFIEKLRSALAQPLSGGDAHALLEPSTRKKYKISHDVEHRKSAVMILIYRQEETFCTVSILRPKYQGVHSAQVSFPGGEYEPEDMTLCQTAIRETFEEIGVRIDPNNILGKLSDIYIPPSNFDVSPYVAYLEEAPQMNLDKYEVDRVIRIDLKDLIASDSINYKSVNVDGCGLVEVPCFYVENQIIWGATAMILSELRMLLAPILFDDGR